MLPTTHYRNPRASKVRSSFVFAALVSVMLSGCESSDDDETAEVISGETATGSVLCDYTNDTYNSSQYVSAYSTVTWSCDGDNRSLTANGIPDHEVGAFPNSNNPSEIEEQSVSDSFSLNPVLTTSASELGGPRGTTGYVLNGIKIDANTGGTCDDSGDNCTANGNAGSWNIEALGHSSFSFGTDENNAHVQPGGVYHYHGMPEGFISKMGGGETTMTLIGWAADGFPIYARYGYSDPNDSNSELKVITGSYQLISDVSDSRPPVDVYEMGTFVQDWEYVEGSGDLDECNGREGVTPEFPEGIYHYFATDTYPYFQRCVKGAL